MALVTPPAPSRAGVLPLPVGPELLLAPRGAVVARDLEKFPVKYDVLGEVILLEEGPQQPTQEGAVRVRLKVQASAVLQVFRHLGCIAVAGGIDGGLRLLLADALVLLPFGARLEALSG